MTAGLPDAAEPPFGMTDLEEHLRADNGAEVGAAILSRLAQLDGDIGAMVRRGLAPDDFRRAKAIQGAIAAAQGFLTRRR